MFIIFSGFAEGKSSDMKGSIRVVGKNYLNLFRVHPRMGLIAFCDKTINVLLKWTLQ